MSYIVLALNSPDFCTEELINVSFMGLVTKSRMPVMTVAVSFHFSPVSRRRTSSSSSTIVQLILDLGIPVDIFNQDY